MTFYLRFNKLFYSLLWKQLTVPAIFGLGCYLRIARGSSFAIFDYILLVCFAFFLVVNGIRIMQLVLRIIFKKPSLTVNEVYLYDHYKKIKYFWKDVKEAIEDKDILYMHLSDPGAYIDAIENPWRRFFAKFFYRVFKKTPSYQIELSHFLYTANEPILKILDEFSIKSVV